MRSFLFTFFLTFAINTFAADNSVEPDACHYKTALDELSLVAPGTNIERLCALHPAVAAGKWLQILHEGTPYYESALKFLRYEVNRGALRLSDLGTGEQELKKLAERGSREAATMWYKFFLAHPNRYEEAFNHIRLEALKGGFSPDEIGDALRTKQLTLLGSRIAGERCVEKMRESGNTDDDAARCVVKQARVGGYMLAELGTNEIEVRYRGAREPEHPGILWAPKIVENE